MKRIFKVVAFLAGLFIVMYSLVAFIIADFNFMNWTMDARMGLTILYGFISAFCVGAYIDFLNQTNQL